MGFEEILENLDDVKKVGHDRYVARCPVHDDAHASLSIARGEKVAVLLRCFACGARFENILHAIEARAAGVR